MTAPERREPDRRAADRRRGDRRARARRADAAASWFGDRREAGATTDGSTRPGAARWPDDDPAADGARPPSTFQRLYRAFLGARAALGVVLVAALLLTVGFGNRPAGGVAFISLAYAAWALCMWLLTGLRGLPATSARAGMRLDRRQWLATIGVDIVAFGALHLLSTAANVSDLALLVLPMLMAGALTARRHALATVAAVVIGLLLAAWFEVLQGGEPTLWLTQAGLAGTGLFLITVLTADLSSRLAREEVSARGSMVMVRQQVGLNQLVIEELHDGVLVVDRQGWVRTANPAARRLLCPDGMAPAAPFSLHGSAPWQALVATVERAFGDEVWPEEGRDVTLAFDAATSRTLRLRIRFTRSLPARPAAGGIRSPGVADVCVLLLEDVRTVQARGRQEKLAAMGRVSAGIAHEIRNPLAAIAQANALLAEDAVTETQAQLTRMVEANVERLKRIVDDVMAAAPGGVGDAAVIDVTAAARQICAEWVGGAAAQAAVAGLLTLDAPAEPLAAWFDAEHLRRVLVNLLDNACRHGSGRPGSVQVQLRASDSTQLTLSVASDGPPIAADVERHLFEPFFSTRSRGTGLGLYVCRELCERYSARIDYRLRPTSETNRNEFEVRMRRHPPR